MKRRGLFLAQLAFALLVCAFLIGPMILSMMAGVTVNFQRGLQSGLTLRWIDQVIELYLETIFLSLRIALACLVVTLAIGVPAASVAKAMTLVILPE